MTHTDIARLKVMGSRPVCQQCRTSNTPCVYSNVKRMRDKLELESGFTSRYRVSLALIYYSARIILSRPCLTRPDDNKETGIKFPRSRFGNDTALVCLQASLSLTSVFPDQPDAAWAYNISPWWSTLHFLAQATTILLIHMSVGPVPVASEGRAEQYLVGAAKAQQSPLILFWPLARRHSAGCTVSEGLTRRLGGFLNSTVNLLIASLTPGDWTSTT